MENNKETTTSFLELLMDKVHLNQMYSGKDIITDEETSKIRSNFTLQLHWAKHRSRLPKKIKETL